MFIDTPGYDPMSLTGQVAGGCNNICFTTGPASVSGFKSAPCIKVATNSEMFEPMREGMGINSEKVISGEQTVEDAGTEIFERIVALASGDKTKRELCDYGDNEFVPWRVGAAT